MNRLIEIARTSDGADREKCTLLGHQIFGVCDGDATSLL
jgi:hypothetical protein